ncbi:MotA/TolQ/ExbB proton channel family protein [bacterium]|nr:MotA/TolQ/ExbB proton channel family protein [bacterium]
MFQDLTFWQLLAKGGWTMVVLMIFSLISWYIIFERAIRYHMAKIDVEHLMLKVKKMVQSNKHVDAGDLCQETPGPVAATLKTGLRYFARGALSAREAMERVSALELLRLEHLLSLLATIGSISPFIGLFGTVLGIINAFSALADSSAAGASVVSSGIAEALVATAGGLFTAVPAVIAYNYFVRRVTRFDTEMATSASDLLDSMYGSKELHKNQSDAYPPGMRGGA